MRAFNVTCRRLTPVLAVPALMLLFIAPVKFGLAEAGISIPAPHTFWEWVLFSYPNNIGRALMIAVGVGAALAAVMGHARVIRRKSVSYTCLGWALLLLGMVFADRRLPAEWRNNSVRLQFLLYGVWYFSVLVLLAKRRLQTVALLVVVTAGALVSLEAIRQFAGGLEDMRDFAAKQAGFDTFSSYTNHLLSVFPDGRTWLHVKKLASNRVFGTFIYPNALGGFLLVFLPLCVGLYKTVSVRLARVLAVLSFCLGACALVFSRSKASICLAVAGLITLLWLARRAGNISKRFFLGAVAGLVIFGAAMLAWGYGTELTGRLKATGSARMDYWRAAVKMIKARPWRGWGTGGFSRNYPIYRRPGAEDTRLAHNVFLNIWTDYGIVGVAGAALVLGLPLVAGWRRMLCKANFDWVLASCLVAGTGFVLHCLVDFDFRIIGITIPALFALASSDAHEESEFS